MNLIKLKCENCGAKLEVNEDLDEIVCNYCGSKILIDDDASELRRIEDVKLDARKKNYEQSIKERNDLEGIKYQEKFKNGKLKIIIIIFLIIILLFTFVAFKDKKLISGIIGIIQSILLLLSWLFGMCIIKEKFKYLHIILFLVALFLTIIFLSF